MIEQIMYFLLGVLLATLVALLVLPAVWHRAVRLTTRRVEAAVPVSLFEIQADKDQQRAFFALNQRRLELQIDEMRETIAAHAATIEAQRLRVAELEGLVTELTQSGEKSGAVAAERQVLVGELQDQVSDLKTRIAGLEGELGSARAAHASLEGAHGTLSEKTQALTQTLAERDTSLSEHGERATQLTSEIALLTTNLTATAQRLDVTADLLEKERATVARITEELRAARASLADKEDESARRAAKAEELTAERDRLKGELATAKGDLDASRAVLHAFEQRRASEFAEAETQARRITSDLDRMRADHALMAGALEKARGGDEAGRSAEPEGDLSPVKVALADVAARIVALATRLEGEASPVPALLAHDAGTTGTSAAGEALSLATRIRTLLEAPAERAPMTANGAHAPAETVTVDPDGPVPEETAGPGGEDEAATEEEAEAAVLVAEPPVPTTSRKSARKQASS